MNSYLAYYLYRNFHMIIFINVCIYKISIYSLAPSAERAEKQWVFSSNEQPRAQILVSNTICQLNESVFMEEMADSRIGT